jgi:hypothetical protein
VAETTGITVKPEHIEDLESVVKLWIGTGLRLHEFTGVIDGENRTFVLDAAPPSAALLWIFWNGMKQRFGSYAVSDAIVTLDSAPRGGEVPDTLEFFF